MARIRKEYGPSEGQRIIRGLADAACQVAAEEKNVKKQLELFDKLKTENTKYKM
jgi:hypothetical protein